MDIGVLVLSVTAMYNGWYWCVPLMGMVSLTLLWEKHLSQLDRWKWKLSPVPKYVIQGCEYYNNMTLVKFINDNLSDVYDMIYDIVISAWKSNGMTCRLAPTNKMKHLITRLDRMPYDIIKDIPPEQMEMVRENTNIQKLIGKLDDMMENNEVLRERLHQAKLDSRIKNLIQSLKKE